MVKRINLYEDAVYYFVRDIYNNISGRGILGSALVVSENEIGAITSFVSFYPGLGGGDERNRDSV